MGSLMEYRRRILLNTPHLESASGSVAHFKTDMAAKLKECRVNFLPQQAGSGDPSPSNVRSISGWTGLTVWKAKKNVAHVVGYSAVNIDSPTSTRGLTNSYGTTISTTNFSSPDTAVTITQSQALNEPVSNYRNGYIAVIVDNLKFGEKYNISFKVSNITSNPLNVTLNNIQVYSPSGSNRVVSVDGDRVYCNIIFSQSPNTPNKMSFEIRICGMSFTLSEFMVTPVEDEDYTYEPYDHDKITVSWDNLGTIYGGFIDVLRGELVQEWAIVDLGDLNWTYSTNNHVFYNQRYNDMISTAGQEVLCTHYPCNILNVADMPDKSISSRYQLRFQSVMVKDSDLDGMTTTEFKAAMSGIVLAYQLETPITYPLSPEIIKTLKGVNNVFSDANGDVSVKYWTH